MEQFKPRISDSRILPKPNQYVQALLGEYRDFAFDQDRAPGFQGQWRSEVFKVPNNTPLDLEIGTGNGLHFHRRLCDEPRRCLVGIERKYKPLVQSIRRAVKDGLSNGRAVRFHAFNVEEIFLKGEINDVFIHFPDPWFSPRKPQNRLSHPILLNKLFDLQQAGSLLEFKTDSRELFLWTREQIKNTAYQIEIETQNLHHLSDTKVFMTQFERLFVNQGKEINYLRLRKP